MDDRTLRTDLASHQVTATLPKVDDQRELARQLMLGGYDPEHLDPLLRPAYDAFVQVWKHPNVQEVHTQIQLAARSQPPRRSTPVIALKAGDQMIGMYSYANQPDGSTTFRIDVPDRQAEARGTSANTSFQVKLPTVTQQEYQAELARRKQVRDDAATHALKLQQEEREALQQRTGFWGSIVADTIFDPGAPTQTAQDHATDALKQARRQYEQLLENGKDVIIYDRLRNELAKEQYRDRVGGYNRLNEFTKGLVDIGTGTLAIPARAVDAWNGNDEQMQNVAAIQQAYEGALPDSTRPELENAFWGRNLQSARRGAGLMLPFLGAGRVVTSLAGAEARLAMAGSRLGIAGGGSAATLVGQDQLQLQQRINALRAAGDQATADRLSTGRDLHSLLTGVLAGSLERLSPAQMLRPSGKGLGSLAYDVGMEGGVENVINGIGQRALVDPLINGGELPTLRELLAPTIDEATTGLLLGGPMALGAHARPALQGSLDNTPAHEFNASYGTGRRNLIDGELPADGSTQFDRSDTYDRFRTLHAALEARSKELSAASHGQQRDAANAGPQAVSGVPTVRFDGDGRITLAVDQGSWWKALLRNNGDNATLALKHAEELAGEELWHTSQLVAMRNDWLATPGLRGSFTSHVQQHSRRLLSDVRTATEKLSPDARATVQEAMHGAWATYFNDGVPYKDGHAALFDRVIEGGTQATPPAFVAEFLRQLQQSKRRGFTSETADLIDRLKAWVRSALDSLRATAGMTQRGELGPQIQSLMQRMQDVMDGKEVAAPFQPGTGYRSHTSSFSAPGDQVVPGSSAKGSNTATTAPPLGHPAQLGTASPVPRQHRHSQNLRHSPLCRRGARPPAASCRR